jgi:hypothetical protein
LLVWLSLADLRNPALTDTERRKKRREANILGGFLSVFGFLALVQFARHLRSLGLLPFSP